MKSQQVTGTSWLAVMVASLAGFGLLLAPAEQTDLLRVLMRDAALPGLRLVDAAHERVMTFPSQLELDLTVGVPSPELVAERDLWQQKYRKLESVNTQLAGALEQAREERTSPFLADPGTPLFVPELIEASVVGAEELSQLTQRASFRRIIDVGTHDDVIPADFVVNSHPDQDAVPPPLIDQGADSGLQLDQPVFAGRCVVGKVGQVGRWTSTIIPLTDLEFSGRGQLVRSTEHGAVLGAEGVITGDGEGKCLLKYVPGTEPVAVGDVVYTPVGHSNLPVPMYYGTVIQASLNDQAQDWTIVIEPAESIDGTRRVQVLRAVLNTARTSSLIESPLPPQQEPSS
ncbi:MAG: rod shape-determining protein MreC [Planctomycetaceae bacterium]|nr:rod shape-determining protein MreC [Planctomycetaceae bacterium]